MNNASNIKYLKGIVMESTSLVWIEQSEDNQAHLIEALQARGMNIILRSFAELSDEDISKSSAIVITAQSDINLVEDVQSRQTRLNCSSPLIVRVDREDFELAIEVMRKGATTVVPSQQQSIAGWMETLSIAKVHEPKNRSSFIFADPVSRNLLALTERVSKADVTVLLSGPTGSGKEVLAKILHDASPRHSKPFIAFNCAAMPENLVEDMLFGHDKGAFTGATKDQPGLFEQAQDGTIFLDEIGEMSFNLQVKLLRVLQERNITRLGGQASINLNIRVIAATNRNLKSAIQERSFREDLYFRLSAFKLTVPSLKQRPLDILPLAEHFINQQTHFGPRVTLSAEAQKSLSQYHWPGNVRELQNVILRALVITPQSTIESQHLIYDDITDFEDHCQTPSGAALINENSYFSDTKFNSSEMNPECLSEAVRSSEYKTIMTALQSTRNREQAANALGISARTLRHKLQRLREEGMSVTRAYAR